MKPNPSEQREAQRALEAQLAHDEAAALTRIKLQTAGQAFTAAWDTLAAIIGQEMARQGFNGQKSFPTDIALMHSELSEALEADRKGLLDDKLIQSEGRAVELADTVIRILHAQNKYALESVGGLIVQKAVYNTTRPYKHGKGY